MRPALARIPTLNRYADAARMRRAGMTYKAIGLHFGVSDQRGRQLVANGEYWAKPGGHHSPYVLRILEGGAKTIP